jgi:hypothetical protein
MLCAVMAQSHFTWEDPADPQPFILHGERQEERPCHFLFHEPIIGHEMHDLTFIADPSRMYFRREASIADMSERAMIMFRKDGEEAA